MSQAARPAASEHASALLSRQRWRLLAELNRAAGPLLDWLGLAWLIILVVEFARGESNWLTWATQGIWALFIIDALIRFALAPRKLVFLRRNWFSLIALAVPALRVLRVYRALPVLRAARAVRGLRLVRVLTTINRAMRSFRRTLRRKRLGYVIALTLSVTLVGSAGMFVLEQPPEGGIATYGDALWWTAMIITTMGSEYWPRTLEGRVLAVLLSTYALAVFGYVTAAIASVLVENSQADAASRVKPALEATEAPGTDA